MLRLALSASFLGTTMIAQSQKAEDELVLRARLADERRQFEAELGSAAAPTNTAFLARLRSFERQAAGVDDFTEAIRFRDQKLALAKAMLRHNPQLAHDRVDTAIRPSPTEASLEGAVFLQQGMLKGWKSSATAATWNLRGLKPGNYEVFVTYSCSKETKEKSAGGDKKILLRAGGQFSLAEASRLVRDEQKALVHQVLPTKDWETFRDVSLGEIALSNAAVSLRLSVIETKPLGLMCLKSLRLHPLPEQAAAKPLPQPSDLRRSFQGAVERRKEKLQRAYGEDLKALQQRANASGDKQLKQEIGSAINALPQS